MKYQWILAVLLVGTVVYGDPSIWFAKEGAIGFALIRGAKVTGTDLVSEYATESFCHCRRMCYVNPSCNGASYAEEGGMKQCRTFTGGFFYHSFGLKDNAILMLKNITKHWFHIGVDGRLYLVISQKISLYTAAERCERIPGFHLGVYKDVRSTEVLREIHESFGYGNVAIDMRHYNSGATWSDGTPFERQIYQANSSGSYTYYMLQNQVFQRSGPGNAVHAVCQAYLQNGRH